MILDGVDDAVLLASVDWPDLIISNDTTECHWRLAAHGTGRGLVVTRIGRHLEEAPQGQTRHPWLPFTAHLEGTDGTLYLSVLYAGERLQRLDVGTVFRDFAPGELGTMCWMPDNSGLSFQYKRLCGAVTF